MRPDEHKKKKNAAYKKKHGINKGEGDEGASKKDSKSKGDKGKNAAERKPDSSKGRDGKSAVPSRTEGKRDNSRTSSRPENVPASSDSSSSDSEVETQNKRQVKKTFRRREIVSNWQKYELEPETDEKNTAKGENYEKLLNMAGEAMSHFRFKDELEWEDHSDAEQTGADSYTHLLSLNPSHLAQSLACLPVHEVLDISQDLFTEDQLTSMAHAAKGNRSAYDTHTSQEGTEGFVDPSKEEAFSVNTSPQPIQKPSMISSALKTSWQAGTTSVSTTTSVTESTRQTKSVPRSEKPVNPGKTITMAESEKKVDKAQGELTDEVVHSSQAPSQRLTLQDEDLDALLDLESPAVTESEKVKVTSPPQAQINSSATSTPAPSVPSTKASNAKKGVSESAELEDWLDSILDD